MGNELLFVRKALKEFCGNGVEAIDLGCGYGRNSLFLMNNGFNVTAVDWHRDCLASIKRKSDRIITVQADLAKYDFVKEYDFILCTFVLHYFDKNTAQRLVREMVEHLKKGGVLAIALMKIPQRLGLDDLLNGVLGLSTINLVEKSIHDDPHAGANYPHNHDVIFYIGTKK